MPHITGHHAHTHTHAQIDNLELIKVAYGKKEETGDPS